MTTIKKTTIGLCIALLLPLTSSAVIFGYDNRNNVDDSFNRKFRQAARSTVAMIGLHQMNYVAGSKQRLMEITGIELNKMLSYKFCPKTRFKNQLTAANCSGFLIAPDLIATAGHCIKNGKCNRSNRWVFDFKNANRSGNKIVVKARDVFKCRKVLAYSPGMIKKQAINDYAIIRLNRVVRNRTPLKIRISGKITSYTDIATIGHPFGLPAIVASEGHVTGNNKSTSFDSSLATFPGNSGGVVLNTRNMRVEGIHVRGVRSIALDKARKCVVVLKYPTSFANVAGAIETRITAIPGLNRHINNSFLAHGKTRSY